MNISQISKVYANSLSDIDSNTVISQLPVVIETISGELKSVLENPSVSKAAKIDIIEQIFLKKIDDRIVNFIKILIEKDRINLLFEIYEYVTELNDQANNIKAVRIISARELDDDAKNKVIKKIEQKLSMNIRPDWIVSDDIIAGLIIKFDDTVFDSSLKTKIDNLRKDVRSVKWY